MRDVIFLLFFFFLNIYCTYFKQVSLKLNVMNWTRVDPLRELHMNVCACCTFSGLFLTAVLIPRCDGNNSGAFAFVWTWAICNRVATELCHKQIMIGYHRRCGFFFFLLCYLCNNQFLMDRRVWRTSLTLVWWRQTTFPGLVEVTVELRLRYMHI